MGNSPWSCQEWDMTEQAQTSLRSTKLEDLFFWPQLLKFKAGQKPMISSLMCRDELGQVTVDYLQNLSNNLQEAEAISNWI